MNALENSPLATYGETPIGAECFTASAITNGICSPNDPNVPDVASYPYTIWSYTSANVSRRSISAPYRFSATETGILGYSLSEPVQFVPHDHTPDRHRVGDPIPHSISSHTSIERLL